MAFEYIGNAETIARQLLPWGIGLLGFGIGLLIFSQIKDKALAYNIASFALIAAGAYMLFQAKTLNQSSDDWHITANLQQIDWRSPDERIDQSFSIGLQDIAYIDKAATPSATDSRPVYRLIGLDESVIKLSRISGIDLDAFVQFLTSQGVEIKATEKYRKPVEERNR